MSYINKINMTAIYDVIEASNTKPLSDTYYVPRPIHEEIPDPGDVKVFS